MPLFPPEAKIPLPIQEALRDFFVDLLGKGAVAEKGTAFDAARAAETEGKHYLIGLWTDDRGRPSALCITELLLAAAMGAALVLAPATALPEVQRTNVMPENLLENYREVLNILTSMMNSPKTPHLRLSEVLTFPAEQLPNAAFDLMTTPGQRRDYLLRIEGYADGRLALLTR